MTDIESDTLPPGLSEDVVRAISAKKNEPAFMIEWRLKALSALAVDEGAALAEREVRSDRLSGHQLLLGAENEEAARQPRRGRSRAARRRTRSSAFRFTEQKMLTGVAVDAIFDSVSVGTTMREELVEVRHHLLLVRRSAARASRSRREVPRLGRAVQRQLFRGAEQRRVLRRIVRLRAEGRALSRSSCRRISASTRRTRASSSER